MKDIPTVQLQLYVHPENVLNANDRHAHWSGRSDPASALHQMGVSDHRKPGKFHRVKIDAYVSYPDRTARDVLNLYPTVKYYIDGLVNGGKGILPDDNDLYLSGPHMHWSGSLSPRRGHFFFVLFFTPLEPMEFDEDAVGPKLLAAYKANALLR